MVKRLTKKEKETIYNLGITAFKNGLPCIPANDKELMEKYITGCQVGEGIPYTKAWLKGWHDANLGKHN